MLPPKLRFLTLSALMASNLSFATAEEAESTIRIGRATETQEGPVIDGMVDEEVWEQADVLTDFIQAEPHQGQPATEKTEVRILFERHRSERGKLYYQPGPVPVQLQLHSFRLPSVVGSVQRLGGPMVGQPALYLAHHREHRPVCRVQYH